MNIPDKLKILKVDYPAAQDLVQNLNSKLGMNNRFDSSVYSKEILDLVINIWRIKSRVIDGQSKGPKEGLAKEDVKKIVRYLESIYDGFSRLGIEIIDRTGESFDYGLPEKVVTAKPQEGRSKEIVLETLRPTIKWNNQIYPGEVEIATPITKNDKETS